MPGLKLNFVSERSPGSQPVHPVPDEAIHNTRLDYNCTIRYKSTKSMERGKKRNEALAANIVCLVFTH